jgi:hypothetical protein
MIDVYLRERKTRIVDKIVIKTEYEDSVLVWESKVHLNQL